MPIQGKTELLKVAYRIYESAQLAKIRFMYRNLRYITGVGRPETPLPPLKLMVWSGGSPDISWFIKGGKLATDSIIATLAKNGVDIESIEAMLDFGCGCGRVIRHWKSLKTAQVYGSDYNSKQIDWCQRNLTFAQFDTNSLYPPLIYNNDKFDLIYAFSVFTHLPEELQILWINELSRILKPGGHLLISTHGLHYLDMLSQNEKEKFLAGQLVVRYEEMAGTNMCGAYHPVKYVTEQLADRFEVIDFIPKGAKGNPYQDIFLLRKPLG